MFDRKHCGNCLHVAKQWNEEPCVKCNLGVEELDGENKWEPSIRYDRRKAHNMRRVEFPGWYGKAIGIIVLCLFAVFMLALCTMPTVHASPEIGLSIKGDYFTTSSAPAGWLVTDPGKNHDVERYFAAETIFIKDRWFRAAVEGYMGGNKAPEIAGLRAGLGWSNDIWTISLWHHSCHNLDRTAFYIKYVNSNPENVDVPSCQFNGISVRLTLGTTFQPLW